MSDFELGLSVKSDGVDEAKGKFHELSAEIKDTAKSSSDLAAQSTKTSASLNFNSLGMRSAEGEKLNQTLKQTSQTLKDVAPAAATASNSLKSFFQGIVGQNTAGGSFANLFRINFDAAAAATATAGIRAASTATKEFREGIHILNPVLNELGGSIGGLGHFASAARAGLIGLAVAITGSLVVGLEKAGDAVDLVQRRLTTLFGSSSGRVFDALTKGAEEANISLQTLLPSIQALQNATQLGSKGFQTITTLPGGGVELTRGLGNAVEQAKKFEDVATTLNHALQVEGATATDAAKDVNALTKSMSAYNSATGDATGLTKEMYLGLKSTAPALAKLLDDAFGPTLFEKLQKGPIALQNVLNHITAMKPRIDWQLAQAPRTVAQSWDDLKTAAEDFMGTLGHLAKITGVTDFFSGLAGKLKDFSKELREGTGAGQDFLAWLSDLRQDLKDKGFWGALDLRADKMNADIKQTGVDIGNNLLDSIQSVIHKTNPFLALSNYFSSLKFPTDGIATSIDEIQRHFDKLNGTVLGMKAQWEEVGSTLGDAMVASFEDSSRLMLSNFHALGDAAKKEAVEIGQAWMQASIDASKITQPLDIMKAKMQEVETVGFAAADRLNFSWASFGAGIARDAAMVVAAGEQMIAEFAKVNSASSRGGSVSGAGPYAQGPSFVVPGGGGTGTGAGGSYSYNSGGGGGNNYYPAVGMEGAYYATGGSFQIQGPGGTDAVPVRFMGTTGEIVTITPAGGTPPIGSRGLDPAGNLPSASFTGSVSSGAGSGAAPVIAITSPITFAVKNSAGQIVGAVDNATDAINAMAKNLASATSAPAATAGVTGGSSGPTRVVFDPGPNAKAGSAAGPIGSGPVDYLGNIVRPGSPTYIARVNYNAAIAGSAPGGSGQAVYYVNPNYVGAATGGEFRFASGGETNFGSTVSGMAKSGLPGKPVDGVTFGSIISGMAKSKESSSAIVPGVGGIDSTHIRMALTPGEKITVTPAMSVDRGAHSDLGGWDWNRPYGGTPGNAMGSGFIHAATGYGLPGTQKLEELTSASLPGSFGMAGSPVLASPSPSFGLAGSPMIPSASPIAATPTSYGVGAGLSGSPKVDAPAGVLGSSKQDNFGSIVSALAKSGVPGQPVAGLTFGSTVHALAGAFSQALSTYMGTPGNAMGSGFVQKRSIGGSGGMTGSRSVTINYIGGSPMASVAGSEQAMKRAARRAFG